MSRRTTPDNQPARALHATLGARKIASHLDYHGPGDHRILSCIDGQRFEQLRSRYQQLGLVALLPVVLEAVP